MIIINYNPLTKTGNDGSIQTKYFFFKRIVSKYHSTTIPQKTSFTNKNNYNGESWQTSLNQVNKRKTTVVGQIKSMSM